MDDPLERAVNRAFIKRIIDKAVTTERERCAKICERVAAMDWPPGQYQPSDAALKCAAMIKEKDS